MKVTVAEPRSVKVTVACTVKTKICISHQNWYETPCYTEHTILWYDTHTFSMGRYDIHTTLQNISVT